jgi:hypothetical protein
MTPSQLAGILANVKDPATRQVAADALEEAGLADEADVMREPTNQVCIAGTRVFMLACSHTRVGTPRGVRRAYLVSRDVGGVFRSRRYVNGSTGFAVAEVLCRGNMPGNALHITRAQFNAIRYLFPGDGWR